MNFKTLFSEMRGAVGIVTINRPDQMNSLNGELLQELGEILDRYEGDGMVGALVLTGGTKLFCAGADVKYVTSLKSINDFLAFSRQTRETFQKIETFGKPVIAAIGGAALGGGLEMALCCDLRVASEKAKLGLPETKLGAIPGAGGTQRLPRLIGPALAKKLIFTGNFISADEAFRIGLINEVTSPDECLNKAVELAGEISERAPLALQAAKKCINTGLQVDLESGLNYEAECVKSVIGSEDHHEGFLSFMEKRQPVWKGR